MIYGIALTPEEEAAIERVAKAYDVYESDPWRSDFNTDGDEDEAQLFAMCQGLFDALPRLRQFKEQIENYVEEWGM